MTNNKRIKREHPTKPKDAPAPLPSSPTTMYLQRGEISILSALAAELPDVLTAIILPKLSMEDTLNLAQVSKWFRDVVWSVGGVRSLEAKTKAARPDSEWMSELMYYAARFGNVPAVRALLQSGEDVNKLLMLGAMDTAVLRLFMPPLPAVTRWW